MYIDIEDLFIRSYAEVILVPFGIRVIKMLTADSCEKYFDTRNVIVITICL